MATRRAGKNIGRAPTTGGGDIGANSDPLPDEVKTTRSPELSDPVGAIPDIGKGSERKSNDKPVESPTNIPKAAADTAKSQVPLYTSAGDEGDKDHLKNVEISKRSGNYLLSVGLPRSGKTVLQSFMTYYMDVGGKLSVDLESKEKDSGFINYEAERIKTKWLESWSRGALPDSTPVGEDEIRELRLNVTNQENKRQKFNFSFLEVSGENFVELVPDEQRNSTLFKRLKDFLSNKKIKMNIAFVLKPDDEPGMPRCDSLFTNFHNVVTNHLGLKIKNRAGLILIVPNTKALFSQEDWERSRRDKKFYEKIMKDYIYQNHPATYKIFDNWKEDNRAIMSFHIGDVENEILAKADFQDVKAFIGLNYRMFTGKKLAPKHSWLKGLMGG